MDNASTQPIFASLRRTLIATTVLCCSLVTSLAANRPPEVAIGNEIYAIKNQSYVLSYSDLRSLCAATDTDGNELSLIISELSNGSLSLNGGPLEIGTSLIKQGDVVTWTPPTNAYNIFVPAFSVRAFDGEAYSETAAAIGASIRGNNPPELTFVEYLNRENLKNAHKNEPYTLTFDVLKSLSDLRDMDDDEVSFKIESVLSGTALLDGQPISSDRPFGKTNILTWFPPTNTVGKIVALNLFGFDGTDVSATTALVSIQVTDPTPRFTKGADQKVLRDDFGQFVFNWATAIGPDEFALHFELSNDNPALFLSEPEISEDGTLSYMVAPSVFGQANVTVTLADDQGHRSLPQRFAITVAHVNYAPEFEIPESLTVTEDCGLQQIPDFAHNISAGEGESFQTVGFSVSVTNAALYATKPSLAKNGTLVFKPQTNAFGRDLVTVILKDSGTTANGGQNSSIKTFELIVTPVNDAPAIAVKSIVLNEDQAISSILAISDPDTAQDKIIATIQSLPSASINSASINRSEGVWKLALTPRENANGSVVIPILVSDGENSATYQLPIIINPVNDAPSFELQSANVSPAAIGETTVVPNFATQISPGAANESNQRISFQLTPSDPSFFATKPTMTADGTLKFKLAENSVGSNLVTVIAKDNGPIALGGVNISEARSFYVVVPTNPFPELKGTYVGLFSETSEVRLGSSGFLSASVTEKGSYSGKLMLEGKSYSVAGQFSLLGKSRGVVRRAGLTPLALELNISTAGIDGTVTDGQWVGTISAEKIVHSVSNPAPNSGLYTFTLNEGENTFGVGTLSVNPAGNVSASFNVANGAPLSSATFVTKSGRIPVYASMPGGTAATFGWIHVSPADGGNVSGELNHLRVSSGASLGYTNATTLSGSLYVKPPLGQRAVTLADGVASLLSTTFLNDLNIPVTVSTNNAFSCFGSGLTLKLNLQTGALSGSFIHPKSKLVIPLKGVILQKSSTAIGFFQCGDSGGTIRLH